jgi:hypothetical protein
MGEIQDTVEKMHDAMNPAEREGRVPTPQEVEDGVDSVSQWFAAREVDIDELVFFCDRQAQMAYAQIINTPPGGGAHLAIISATTMLAYRVGFETARNRYAPK